MSGSHANADHRRRRLHRLAPVRTLPRRGPRGRLRRQLHHRQPGQHRPPARQRRFTLHPPRHLAPAGDRRPDRQHPALRLARPARSITCSHPDPDAQGRLARHAQHARPGQGARRPASCSPAPARSTATPSVHPQREDYWGNVNPIGIRGVLRRGQALRRGHHHGLPPLPRRQHAHRPHLQHLRRTHAARRRPRPAQLHGPGPARRAAHGLRRRLADAQLLLRRRPGRRHLPAAAQPTSTSRSTSATRTRSPSSSSPRRSWNCPGSKSHDRVQAAAAGRPEGAPAGHHASAQTLLGWEPKVDRREGMQRTLEYFRKKV